MEEGAAQALAEIRQELQKALERSARDGRQAQRELESLRKDLLALQAELRGCAGDARKLGQAVDILSETAQQLRGDFEALEAETRRAVRQQVAASFTSVESTVLSALESLQEEVLYVTSGSAGPSDAITRPPTASPAPGVRPGGKIIPAEPLFANLRRDETDVEEEESSTDDEEDG